MNSAELLKEYENLKYENKFLMDKQRNCLTQMEKTKEKIIDEHEQKKRKTLARNTYKSNINVYTHRPKN